MVKPDLTLAVPDLSGKLAQIPARQGIMPMVLRPRQGRQVLAISSSVRRRSSRAVWCSSSEFAFRT